MSKKHYFDKIGICLKCDQCDLESCCPQSEECLGTNWDFMEMTNEMFRRIFMERGKNE